MKEKRILSTIMFFIILFLISIIIFLLLKNETNMIQKENEKMNDISENEVKTINETNIKANQISENDNKDEIKIINKNNLLHFNSKNGKIVNEKAKRYTLENNSIYDDIIVNINDKGQVEMNVSLETPSYFPEGIKRKTGYPEIIKGFTNSVDEVVFGIIGQDISGGIILFLMEDGTVEYIGLNDALKTNNLLTRGKLNNLRNIVRIENASISYEDGGEMTLIAIDKDGTFSDIGVVIREQKIDLSKIN